jgi:triacylglycerol lipase
MNPLQSTSIALAASVSIVTAAPESPRHVVLIHGIWDTFHTLRKMERALAEAGFEPLVVSLTPNNGRVTLDTLGEQVNAQISRAIPADEPFSIVGFSMGGLVARAYLRQQANPRRVPVFVSIASPHRGTWMAWLNNFPGVRDMRPGSAFLAEIDADVARYSATRWITIRTPLDLMILPSTSSGLPWAENHVVPVLAHPLLVLDPRVIETVVVSLGGKISTRSARARQASPHAGSPQPRSQGTPPPR